MGCGGSKPSRHYYPEKGHHHHSRAYAPRRGGRGKGGGYYPSYAKHGRRPKKQSRWLCSGNRRPGPDGSAGATAVAVS